jgi:anthranilate synthase component 2
MKPFRLLMVDNYDSFTWNLVQYLGELGARVDVVRNDELSVDEVLAQRAELDGLVISPGPCSPTEAGISVPLIERLASPTTAPLPLLGVCLGHQSMAQALGGSIVRTGTIMHGKTSPIHHRGTDLFAGLPSPFPATRYHSLMAKAEDLPACLEVTAWTDDPGRRVIMGLAHKTLPMWGVQFHPESILTEGGKGLLMNFLRLIDAAGARA